MDLSTVRTKLVEGQYVVPKGLIQDIKLIFSNAKSYNEPRSQVSKMGGTKVNKLAPSRGRGGVKIGSLGFVRA